MCSKVNITKININMLSSSYSKNHKLKILQKTRIKIFIYSKILLLKILLIL